MRIAVALLVAISIGPAHAQDEPSLPGKNHYIGMHFGLAMGLTSTQGMKSGYDVGLSYITNFASKGRQSPYYAGLYAETEQSGHKQGVDIPIPNTHDGYVKSKFGTGAIGFRQVIFFRVPGKAKPFLELDAGIRFAKGYGSTGYKYSGLLIIVPVNSKHEESFSMAPSNHFSLGFAYGYFFDLDGIAGVTIKFKVTTGNQGSYVIPSSVTYDTTGKYTYETEQSRSPFFTLSFGFLF